MGRLINPGFPHIVRGIVDLVGVGWILVSRVIIMITESGVYRNIWKLLLHKVCYIADQFFVLFGTEMVSLDMRNTVSVEIIKQLNNYT